MSVYENSGRSSGPQPRPALIRFDAISEAFNLVKQQAGAWVGVTLLYFVIACVTAFPYLVYTFASRNNHGLGSNTTLSLVLRLVFNLVTYAMNSFFMSGLYRMALKQLRGGTLSIADLFSGGDVIGAMFLNRFLIGLGSGLGLATGTRVVLFLIPSLFMSAIWMFAPLLIVDQKMEVVAAMRTSFRTLKNHFWTALGFIVVAGLASSTGLLLCGIGMSFTFPIFIVALTIVYSDFFETEKEISHPHPTIDMPLPPSTTSP